MKNIKVASKIELNTGETAYIRAIGIECDPEDQLEDIEEYVELDMCNGEEKKVTITELEGLIK